MFVPFEGFGTAAIHSAQEPENFDNNEVVPTISLSTTYKQTDLDIHPEYVYSRAGNPTRDVLQTSLAALEDGLYCQVFASGMAAVSAMINILKVGDHIICANDNYGGTQRILQRVSIPLHGLEVSFVDFANLDEIKQALRHNTKMVFMESPSNPLLKVFDIEEISYLVKHFNKDIIVVVDNTFMSPYFQRPLNLGADVVVHSLTKYINGHSDVIMGAVITNDETINKHLLFMQLTVGAVPSPFDCYLVNRGIKTLHLRMKAHMENGLFVAKWLENHPNVEKVFYPQLESHPQHQIHIKQTKGMSGMVSFYLKGGIEESRKFLSNLKIFTLAESLGGYESLAGFPALMTHASLPVEERIKLGITDNLIRLSVGCEDKEDLVADLDQAFQSTFC